jgi:hydroxyacylglutathione hydrolase
MIRETLVVGPLEVNCYVLAAAPGRKALIIDPGDDDEKIVAALERRQLQPGLVVNTHGHYDHIGCDDCFGVEVCIHRADAPMLKEPKLNFSAMMGDFYKVRSKIRQLEDGQEVVLDGLRLRVIHTPGHSAGSICLLLEEPEAGILFSGDTLFRGGVGRSDLQGGDELALQRSLQEKLLVLPAETLVYPGHGRPSTLGREKSENPFIR